MTSTEIKELRTKLNMTQVEFARKIDVQPVTVSRWERGTCVPHKNFVKAMKRMG